MSLSTSSLGPRLHRQLNAEAEEPQSKRAKSSSPFEPFLKKLPQALIQYALFSHCTLQEQAAHKCTNQFLNKVPYLLTEDTEVTAHVTWWANQEVYLKIKALKIALKIAFHEGEEQERFQALQTWVAQCKNVKSLNVSGYYGSEINEMLVKPQAHFAQLTKIDLGGCYQLTDASIQSLAQHCPCLTEITLEGCRKLTDTSIKALAQHCPCLTEITLEGCNKLTDISIKALAQHCPQLNHLYLGYCKQITDVSIHAIAQNCPQLIYINLNACNKLKETSIQKLVQSCLQLNHINLSNCDQLSDALISSLNVMNPKLRVYSPKLVMTFI